MEVDESNENSLEGSQNNDENSPPYMNTRRKSRQRGLDTRSTVVDLQPQEFMHPNPSVQSKPCFELTCGVGKCMVCSNKTDNKCRFITFRKLHFAAQDSATVSGFLDSGDYSPKDLVLWMPQCPPDGLSFESAKYLLEQVGYLFDELVKQEKSALIYLGRQVSQQVVWKQAIPLLREMCDVCSTTIFNYHWTCGKCGFQVCGSCYEARINRLVLPHAHVMNDESMDAFGWLKCHLNNGHKTRELMLTQIVARNSLDILWCKSRQIRGQLKIPLEESMQCYGKATTNRTTLESDALVDGGSDRPGFLASNRKEKNQSNNRLEKCDREESDDTSDDDDAQAAIMDLIGYEDADEDTNSAPKHSTEEKTFSAVPNAPVNDIGQEENSEMPLKHVENKEMELKHFIRREGSTYSIKIFARKMWCLTESSLFYPNVKHSWLCHGYLLHLLEPTNPGNLKLFQQQWKRGQPVIVSNVSSMLDKDLWSPESFSRDFGDQTNDLINCITGKVVPGQEMRTFWDGFEHMKMRLRDENDQPMLLKLKDWPGGGHDFEEMLPNRFEDLVRSLPLEEYTSRDGEFNLVARLPSFYDKPDLGPTMCIAYGSRLHLDEATTNLRMNISDAVNVLAYVGIVKDEDDLENKDAVMKAIEESDCDNITVWRGRKHDELPGALWHVWDANDADKIRDMLNKRALERGKKVERFHDAIHDQSWYLDKSLIKILREEYNVSGYPILQCEGDAIFIPAGSPYQVRNLNNCIEIEQGFVSPENVGHCFNLTEEFRNLTETHINHEDKLQIKHIMYHTVKDVVAVLQGVKFDSTKKN